MAAKRSHPPGLLKIVQRTFLEEFPPLKGRTILLALSGGPDSVALCHVMSRLQTVLDFRLHAHSIDHGFRIESADEVLKCAEFCLRHEIPFSSSSLDLHHGSNRQERARDARYADLNRVKEGIGAAFIATGHHAADRAETVLLRILRGAPPEGLAVLPALSGELIRPMIRASKAAIEAYVKRQGLQPVYDPSNGDEHYRRVLIRQKLMPLLEEIDGSVVEHLCRLADEMADSAKILLDPALSGLMLNAGQREQMRSAIKTKRWTARVRMDDEQELVFNRAAGYWIQVASSR